MHRLHCNAAVGAIDRQQEVHRGPSQAPLPRLPPARPRRRDPVPRAHPCPRRQARHQATARIWHRTRPPTPRPRPPAPGRTPGVLAVRATHPPRPALRPRPRRPRPDHHARPRARIHMQQERCGTSVARTATALTSGDAVRSGTMHRACIALTCGYSSRILHRHKQTCRSGACTNLVPRRSDQGGYPGRARHLDRRGGELSACQVQTTFAAVSESGFEA